MKALQLVEPKHWQLIDVAEPAPPAPGEAVEAGCDVALNCWGKYEDMCGLADSLPPASDDCRRRLDAAMEARTPFTGSGADLNERKQALIDERDQLLRPVRKV